MLDGVGPQDRGPHDLLGGFRCATKILVGAGVIDGGSNERCLGRVVGSLRNGV